MRASIAIAPLLVALAACDLRDAPSAETGASRSAAALPADVRPTPSLPDRFGTVGRPAQAGEVRAWDIDVNPNGAGLPAGRGTYAAGAAVYASQCASCHGGKGEGIAPNPKLVGAEPREFVFGRDAKVPKTIGNYWPYATTLYDYVNRAMPFNTPGSLTPDEVYGVVAFLLAENEVIGRDAVMDRETLPKVRMPARERFVRDDRAGGATFR